MIKICKQNPAVLDALKAGGTVYLNAINYLEHAPDADVITFDGDVSRGVIVRYDDDEDSHDDEGFYLATHDEEFLTAFWNWLEPGEKFFSGAPKQAAEFLMTLSEPKWKSPCTTHVFDFDADKSILEEACKSEYEDDFLRINDLEIVDAHYTYRDEHSHESIRKSILDRDSSCIRIDGELAAWCLVHVEDGTLGPLYTMEAHRGKSLGMVVSARLLKKLTQKGKVPHVHVVHGNEASLQMMKKLPYKYSHDCIWFGLNK